MSPPHASWRARRLRAALIKNPQNYLIQIANATFYREHPATDHRDAVFNPPLFPNTTFKLLADVIPKDPTSDGGTVWRSHWAVIGSSDKTTLLEILRGSHLCFPPEARRYPYLSTETIDRKDHRLRVPSRAVQYVGFNQTKGQSSSGSLRGAYLSARYESRREETDWTVLQYLRGETELNPDQEASAERHVDEHLLNNVMSDLRLHELASMPVSNLSNGQTRRARIAKALLGKPELLLLDEPFMGLDPPTLVSLSPILKRLAENGSPSLILALRPQDPIPDWITHLIVLGHNHTMALSGFKARVLFALHRWLDLSSKSPPGQHNAHPIPQAFGRRMSEMHGPPPTGIGDVLTDQGITQYPRLKTFDDPDFLSKVLNDEGIVRPKTIVGRGTRKSITVAAAKPLDEMTLEDLTALVMPVANVFEAEENIMGKSDGGSKETADGIMSGTEKLSEREDGPQNRLGEPLVEMSDVVVRYGTKTVLGHSKPGLNMTIRQGTRLALLGPNGSGKTTLLSLLTSDHPQSYSLPIEFFGRSRLPTTGKPGLSLWEIQSRIGHSSPEIHAFFPRHLTVRKVLESSWAETYAGIPTLNPERAALVDRFLRWWAPELRQNFESPEVNDNDGLEWAVDKTLHSFGVLPFSSQRLLLLLRALIKQPDIVILDEAFSGLPTETRDKAMLWLEHGENMASPEQHSSSSSPSQGDSRFPGLTSKQALIVVSHVKEELPSVVDEWLRLPGADEVSEAGRNIEGGFIPKGQLSTREGWNRVWVM